MHDLTQQYFTLTEKSSKSVLIKGCQNKYQSNQTKMSTQVDVPSKRRRVLQEQDLEINDEVTDITESTKEIHRLQNINQSQASSISKYKSILTSVTYTQLIGDINTLTTSLQPNSVERNIEQLSYLFTRYNDILASDEDLTKIAAESIEKLTQAFTYYTKPDTTEETQQRMEQLTYACVKSSTKLTDAYAQVSQLTSNLAQYTQENKELSQKYKETSTHLKLLTRKVKQLQQCKCQCICGMRNINNLNLDELQLQRKEIVELHQENDNLKQRLQTQIEKSQKLEIELQISQERFVQSNAFKTILQEYKKIQQKCERLTIKNTDLQKQNDFNDEKVLKEIQAITVREEERRRELKIETEGLFEKLSEYERLNSELQIQAQLSQNTQTNLENNIKELKGLLEDLEQDSTRQKKQIHEFQKQKSDLLQKSLSDETKIHELQQKIATFESQMQKITESEQIEPESQLSESAFQSRLSEYRQEIMNLRQKVLKSENQQLHFKESKLRLRREVENLKSTRDVLLTELDMISKAYEETRRKLRTLTLRVTELNDQCTQLTNQLFNDAAQTGLKDKQISALKQTLQAKTETEYEQANVIQEQEQYIGQLQDANSKLAESQRVLEDTLRKYKQQNENTVTKVQEQAALKKIYRDAIKQIEKKTILLQTEAIQHRLQIEKQQKLLEAYTNISSNHQPSPHEPINQEISRLRSIIRCPICSIRIKDCILLNCFHVFCRHCVDQHLDTNQRKCPTCRAKFGEGDVKPIWWK